MRASAETMTEEEADLWSDEAPAEVVAIVPTAPNTPTTPQAEAANVPRSACHAIIFDIETGPLPLDELWKVVPPFDPASLKPFPPFDLSAVKYGNMKDEALKAKKLDECMEKHRQEADEHDKKNATAEADYIASVIDRAALDAVTGRVLAIGYYCTKEGPSICMSAGTVAEEVKMLEQFWSIAEAASEEHKLVGHNITGFDLPFLIRRSWLLDVKIPGGLLQGGRFWASHIVDTMRVWACGAVGGNSFVKLDVLAKAFGVGAKNGDGAKFAELWASDASAAAAYLLNDLELTYRVARRLRVCR